ncbi:hypothetical protein [Endozoicomonas ascidiicola]|uniref:hypothetical protein n=1 Tax=Endozoicomonas ascidiicola TaxID=1698521 RepID=UPI000829ED03|nr:hypothetical protein [Endozoicomonas ascidiicola]
MNVEQSAQLYSTVGHIEIDKKKPDKNKSHGKRTIGRKIVEKQKLTPEIDLDTELVVKKSRQTKRKVSNIGGSKDKTILLVERCAALESEKTKSDEELLCLRKKCKDLEAVVLEQKDKMINKNEQIIDLYKEIGFLQTEVTKLNQQIDSIKLIVSTPLETYF